MAKKSKRNPPWSRDEHILALDYYLQNRSDYFDPQSDGVQQLTRNIHALALLLGVSGSETFRNPAGVSMKLLNFRAHDPDWPSKGLDRGNKLEAILWSEFADQPDKLTTTAKLIMAAIGFDMPVSSQDDDEPEAKEGRLLTRLHRYRERDRSIVTRKKRQYREKHGNLACEACGFDYAKVYGERGADFIECHHTKPISEMEPGETTKLRDLVLLCANCHRMVHAARPWWTFSELKSAVAVKHRTQRNSQW
ncbi:HNH endonuclease [Tateyamaria sp. SN3-11]|uniref:HNH endonuclease n=1 Tax=Tateyamaria sp. SN3-11 TaxID=3092147 RepID=UPI0039E7EA16